MRWLLAAAALPACPSPPASSKNGGSNAVALTIVNGADVDLVVRWVNFKGVSDDVHGSILEPGLEVTQHTFPGHVFEVRDDDHRLVDVVEVPAGQATAKHVVNACEPRDGPDERKDYLTRRLKSVKLPPKKQKVNFGDYVVKDTTCDPSIPSKNWVCVRDAPKRETWPKDKFGFQDGEIDFKNTRGLLKRSVGDTECGESINRFGNVPHYSSSDAGAMVMKMPPQLWEAVKDAYDWFEGKDIAEESPPGGHFSNAGPKVGMWSHRNLDMVSRHRDWIGDYVNSVMEWWSKPGTGPSKRTSTYGFRIYSPGAMLINHRDVENTHVLSAVLSVSQDLDEGWPLYMEKHQDSNSTYAEYLQVYLQPGYMVLYEGARYMHGRPERFTGRSFGAAFVHSTPLVWKNRRKKGYEL